MMAKVLKMMKLMKVMNFPGTGNVGLFTWAGRQKPVPAVRAAYPIFERFRIDESSCIPDHACQMSYRRWLGVE
jgi:hypothetical protein